jgi:hypothetical protein
MTYEYNIQYRELPTLITKTVTGVDEIFYDLSSLNPGTQYQFRVQENDGTSTSDYSAWFGFSTAEKISICTIDLEKALDWQRSKAPILKALIKKKQEWYQANFCDFWNNWTVDVFNLDTANEFGLSVWAIILNEPLFGITQASPADYP